MEALFAHFLDRHPSRRSFVGSLAVLGLGSAGMAAASEAPELTGSTYLFAEITLKPGTVEKFAAVLGEVLHCSKRTVGGSFRAASSKPTGRRTRLSTCGRFRTPQRFRRP